MLIGPHRDDVTFTIGNLPGQGYASHGETWSLALALRLGSFGLLRADGVEPVLIPRRRVRRAGRHPQGTFGRGRADAEQVLVTAAVGSDVPAMLVGHRFHVGGGNVWPIPAAGAQPVEMADV